MRDRDVSDVAGPMSHVCRWQKDDTGAARILSHYIDSE